MSRGNIPGSFLPALDPEDWATDESFFDDSVFMRQPKQKGEGGRTRLAKKFANVLLRSASPEAEELGNTLYKCGPGDRCLSGACICCGEAWGRAFTLHVASMFALDNIALLTVIPSEMEFQPFDLGELNIDFHRNAFLDALAEVGLSDLPIAGGLDLSWNSYPQFHLAFLAPHWHCIIGADDMAEVARRLRAAYRNSRLVNPAVLVKPINETPVWAIRYCFKTEFFDRTQEINDDGSRKPAVDDKITPSSPNFEPLMLALDRIGLEPRVLIQR